MLEGLEACAVGFTERVTHWSPEAGCEALGGKWCVAEGMGLRAVRIESKKQ